MENRIDQTFAGLGKTKEGALAAFVTAGDPDLEFTVRAGLALARGGTDIIELGLPFSDPLADGPVIQRASERALKAGFKVAQLFPTIRELRRQVKIPLLVMSYYNPVLQFGTEHFCRALAEAGGDGLLIPDLPHEEERELRAAARAASLRLVSFAAPTSTDRRLRRLNCLEGGFVYCVSITGVTGVRSSAPQRARSLVERVRRHTSVPVVVGFGVSERCHAAEIGGYADGVVVGSAFVRLLEQLETVTRTGVLAAMERLAAELKAGLRGQP